MSDLRKAPWLHIRGQFSYHGEAYVVGSKAGLIALRDALNVAIEQGEGEATVYANDGEGYGVTVRRTSRVRDMGNPPYIDELAREMANFEVDYMRKQQRHYRNFWAEKRNAATLHGDQEG